MLIDQQAKNPQQTISEVITALRPAAFIVELAAAATPLT